MRPDEYEIVVADYFTKLGHVVELTSYTNDYGITSTKTRNEFELFWEKYIIPLEGQTIYRDNGKSNTILRVDWSGIERLTSNGNNQKIKIEIFKKTILHLFKHGSISRSYINDEYKDRASSGIILILSNTPVIEKTTNPTGLKLLND